jgi:GNAT superfamily N-acetyltransferase
VTSYNDPTHDFRFAHGKVNSDVLVGIATNGSLIGSVMVGHDGHRGWVYYLAADPNYRKQGIGRCMIEAAEQWLKERGVVKSCYWFVKRIPTLLIFTNIQVLKPFLVSSYNSG